MRYYTYTYFHPLTNIPVYVGKGTNKRFLVHFKRPHKFGNWLRKRQDEGISPYPEINWNLSEDEAFAKEKELIAKYGRVDLKTGTLFNLTDGGDGTSGMKLSQEARDKISAANRRRKLSQEARDKLSASHKAMTQETRDKLSASAKGRKMSQEARDKMSVAAKGRTHKPHSQETRDKMSAAHKAMTQETRDKLSIAQKAYCAKKREERV